MNLAKSVLAVLRMDFSTDQGKLHLMVSNLVSLLDFHSYISQLLNSSIGNQLRDIQRKSGVEKRMLSPKYIVQMCRRCIVHTHVCLTLLL